MNETVAAKRFHDFDWRVIRDDAATHFRTGSFAASLVLVEAIGKLPDAANHPPDIDLRSDGVTVRVGTHGGGRSERDLELVRQISELARDLGATVDLTGLQTVQVAIDALVIRDVLPFWRAVLGYEKVGEEDVVDPDVQGPPFWFQQMDAPRPQRNRIHIDLFLPHDQAEARVEAALAAGGHVVNDENAPGTWLLADSEGNEVDVASWPDRD
jgi:4a-hydroxytetrahydrobiopterin dehydratase